MSGWRIAFQSLCYYWRSNLSVMAGVVIGAAVLTGALMVGDCVDATLLKMNLQRLHSVEFALSHPTRFMREMVAWQIETELGTTVAPVIHVAGMAGKSGSNLRANRVEVYGVEERFWKMADRPVETETFFSRPGVWVNAKLARHLDLAEDDTVILRIEKPSVLSLDSPLSTSEDAMVALRLPVTGIVDEDRMGSFDLRAHQVVPFNAFIPLHVLQKEIDRDDRINMMLVERSGQSAVPLDRLHASLSKYWTLADAQLELNDIARTNMIELRTERIFLDDVIQRIIHSSNFHIASSKQPVQTIDILTYLVNEIQLDDRSIPYSVVTSIETKEDEGYPYSTIANIKEGEIAANQWLAGQLNASPGDTIRMKYFVLGQGRTLHEHERSFRLSGIVPMDAPVCDPELMPDFPGIANRENCRDWDPGFDIDLNRIQDRDEDYWDTYRGTPKAFISLNDGQSMWSNRFGNLTAVRFYSPDASVSLDELRQTIRSAIESAIEPMMFGFLFQPVREQALRAANESMNFAPLFVGFSFFIIVSALILVALLFMFQIEQRANQTGILLANGFTSRSIQNLYLLEGMGITLAGALIGILAAAGYTGLLLYALSTFWRQAVGGISFEFVVRPSTLWTGFVSSGLITLIVLWLGIRKQTKTEVHTLLTSSAQYRQVLSNKSWTVSSVGLWWFAVGLILAVSIIALVRTDDPIAAAGKFFGVGSCLLIACIGLSHFIIKYVSLSLHLQQLNLVTFGFRNTVRRTGRSLSIIALLACGSFLVIAIGANRRDPLANADQRTSGTGGFDYFCESTLPILYDLNTGEGKSKYGLTGDELPETMFVSIRVREGDEASCLNLNRAQIPRLLGVPTGQLSALGPFSFANAVSDLNAPAAWDLLEQTIDERVIPAIADQASIQWALGKSLGSRIPFVDEKGNPFEIELVASLSNSIFQGSILISETNFVRLFPSISGYRYLLVDAPEEREKEIATTLAYALQDLGLQVTPTQERLAAFYAVENTYLSIFQILGGFGLILGAAGIAVLVFRNVFERRGELALLQSVGFQPSSVRWLLISEHSMLLLLGLISGVLPGLMAVLPHLLASNSQIPYVSLSITLLALVATGLFWIWLASRVSLQGRLLDALQSE